MRKLERELGRLPGVIAVTRTRGGHIKLTMSEGPPQYTSSTPGGQSAIKNLRAQLRRAMRMASERRLKNGLS
jgi:hypothetical protein